ncbi:FtsQ-type POTRA domain-containing protein [Candidatus Gracilibacteria bacterium]|nr:FtsQ-type POTRA domain-containing protein [Candidatus Gracilibacteria bacterium]
MFDKKRRIRQTHSLRPISSPIRPQGRSPFRRPNPVFTRTKRLLIIAFILFISIFLIYEFFFSGYFLISSIEIKDKEIDNKTMTENIKKTLNEAIGKNIMIIDLKDLELKIANKFPEIKEINISKNYPKTIEVEFAQYPLVANVSVITDVVKKTYIINSLGYAIKENMQLTNLPLIKMTADAPINTGTPVIEAKKLEYIINAINYYQDKFGMKVKETNYKKNAREIRMLTERDFEIWLDIEQSFETQLKKLKKTLVKLDIYKESLSYIDLRIAGENGDKIIYKRK